jgi:hypothetical protein
MEFKPDKFFIGKPIEVFAPPGHMITLAYSGAPVAEVAEGEDNAAIVGKGIGSFACTLLYAEYNDDGEITNATIRYGQGRRWQRTDSLCLKGCSISFIEERPDYEAPTKSATN